MKTFAEIINGRVTRVVVCETKEWLEQRLGGVWEETKQDDPVENYAGPGMGIDLEHEAKFAPDWIQPTHAENAYQSGARVFHNGKIWTSLLDANVWEPGVSGWRDREVEFPDWAQPTGAHDAYQLGDKVTHNGKQWESTFANNVWEPGVFGWVEL